MFKLISAFAFVLAAHPTFAKTNQELVITPENSSPVLISSDLILNPGEEDELSLKGPWIQI